MRISKPDRDWLVRWILLGAISVSMGKAFEEKPLEGVTGERVLITSGEGERSGGLSEEQYLKRVAPLVGKDFKNLLLMEKRPEALSPQARFGMDFQLEGEMRKVGWILDGNRKDGYVLYVDLNVNGDLTDDAPIRFEKENGEYTQTFGARTDSSSPGLMKLTIVQGTPPGESKTAAYLRVHREALRQGLIRVGDREIGFGLIGRPGGYAKVVFDLNGDGKLEVVPGSSEYYAFTEQFVRLGEMDYEFVVDLRTGDKLQLKPLPEKLAETQVLRPGYSPPDFTFQDLDGKMHRLSDYRGKVVLLDFWIINCGWCQAIIPAMVQAHSELQGTGVEIVGINGQDGEEALRPFLAERKMTWTQTIQHKSDGPIHKLYRVSSYPIYYLIGRDGKIAARREGGEGILAEVERVARTPPQPSPNP